jgi:hypothetical protein
MIFKFGDYFGQHFFDLFANSLSLIRFCGKSPQDSCQTVFWFDFKKEGLDNCGAGGKYKSQKAGKEQVIIEDFQFVCKGRSIGSNVKLYSQLEQLKE